MLSSPLTNFLKYELGAVAKKSLEILNDYFCEIKSMGFRSSFHLNCVSEMWNAFKVIFGKSHRRRPLERPERRWEEDVV
jgi:hypothetical protein